MLKSVFKILLIILFISFSIYFYNLKNIKITGHNFIPIIFDTELETDIAIVKLQDAGFSEILSLNNLDININNYVDIVAIPYNSINEKLDNNDYRLDPYIRNISNLFENNKRIYINVNSYDIKNIYKVYKILNSNKLHFTILDPSYIRILLNYLSLILIILLLGIGCKKRFIISLLFVIPIYLLLDSSSFFSYTSFIILYFIIIMFIESISFSNRYIKRNNIGFIRGILIIFIYIAPTYLPVMFNLSESYNVPVIIGDDGFSYETMEKSYSENSVSISNYFTHYTFQKSFLYGSKYLFPTNKNSVTIDEFKREDYYLSRYEKVVLVYDDEFLEDFLSFCETTVLGRFYLDYGRPFKLELNSLLTLYNVNNEYMLVNSIAFSMLIAFLLFRNVRDKKLKY